MKLLLAFSLSLILIFPLGARASLSDAEINTLHKEARLHLIVELMTIDDSDQFTDYGSCIAHGKVSRIIKDDLTFRGDPPIILKVGDPIDLMVGCIKALATPADGPPYTTTDLKKIHHLEIWSNKAITTKGTLVISIPWGANSLVFD